MERWVGWRENPLLKLYSLTHTHTHSRKQTHARTRTHTHTHTHTRTQHLPMLIHYPHLSSTLSLTLPRSTCRGYSSVICSWPNKNQRKNQTEVCSQILRWLRNAKKGGNLNVNQHPHNMLTSPRAGCCCLGPNT